MRLPDGYAEFAISVFNLMNPVHFKRISNLAQQLRKEKDALPKNAVDQRASLESQLIVLDRKLATAKAKRPSANAGTSTGGSSSQSSAVGEDGDAEGFASEGTNTTLPSPRVVRVHLNAPNADNVSERLAACEAAVSVISLIYVVGLPSHP